MIYPTIRVRSIYAEPFDPVALNLTQMLLSVRRCAEYMTQLPRRKIKDTGQGINLEFRVRYISPEPFVRFSFNFTQMFLSVRQCAELITWLCKLKVKVTLQGHVIYPSVCVKCISPEPFERFSFNFSQMFLSLNWCAELLTQLHSLKVKVTF